MSKSFKLLAFNTYDDNNNNDSDSENSNDTENSKEKNESKYMVQMFGINEKGETITIYAEDYLPFFYVKVNNDWNNSKKNSFINLLKNKMGYYYENAIVQSLLIKRKKLYGFDGGKKHTFILIKFKNEAALKKAKQNWYIVNKSSSSYEKKLNPNGFKYNNCNTYLYEGQIPPLLRLFHIKSISPSGWIAFEDSKIIKSEEKKTSCKYEITISYKDIKPQPDKESSVPYKIASFDIEASSSHGDFPLAVKNYKKLAENIVDICSKLEVSESLLQNIIYAAFELEECEIADVDVVYPQCKVSEKMITKQFVSWLKIKAETVKKDIDNDETEDIIDDDENESENTYEIFSKFKKKKYCKGDVIGILNDNSLDRETKINTINKTLNNVFPKLKGDEVTFIGTTFVKYGEKKPYLNHCIVCNSCDSIPELENSKIESYKSEKEVLLAWKDLIKEEDPDIVIGYNIFGFDYQFMFLRAKELKCEREFLELSRNENEICLNKDWRTGKEGLQESTIYLASGQHDLKYINMTGRLQIDLYNYFRRDFQLIKYKLDYVAGYFIGDKIKKIEHIDGKTKIYSSNLTGLENNSFINIEEEAHSVDLYKNGNKFEVFHVNEKEGTFYLNTTETPNMEKKVRWGLAKDDVTPQDIFRMTNEGPSERKIIAKYCIQDCNLVHHLMNKIDVITGLVEMASLCSVPLEFIVLRGQGIKLTSFIAKKCREKYTLMPVLDKANSDEGYEGAIVLEPKCGLYLEDPVACVDFSSLYPSCMISENISHDTKVWTKEYDLNNILIQETGERDENGKYIYDNLPNYKYVDVVYDTYMWRRKNNNPKASMEKVKKGYKICRFAQFVKGKGIMPEILEELLSARKATRKLAKQHSDPFMKNILDKRQLSIKVTANSMYGQTGAKTSSFYEKDCAASTTATGRKLLTYAKRVIEEGYSNLKVDTSKFNLNYGVIIVNAEYVYGDTDSVFFKFNPTKLDGTRIIGKPALEITIELAKQAGELASKFLKKPHDLEYEKTFWPFCLFSKKRYAGMLFENDPNVCKRKSMGIVLNRRDNAPIVKDIYGGIIDILLKEQNIKKATNFLEKCLKNMVEEKYEMDKLIITKSLRGHYKNPDQIAHKVLAERIGRRDPGNKPSVGDRIAYVYINNTDKKALQGERIETPEYILENKLKINYSFYITNQIMKPIQQIFALVLEQLPAFKKVKGFTLRKWYLELDNLKKKHPQNYKDKETALRNKEVKLLLFSKYLIVTNNLQNNNNSILKFI
tara:strand:- start:2556 stop:6332 length:3777 start_codon:yes stop_codon:yes gene_type:complete